MTPQRLEKIESAPGNGMGSEASNPQHLVHGRATDRARFRLTNRKNDEVGKLRNSQAGSGGGRWGRSPADGVRLGLLRRGCEVRGVRGRRPLLF